MQTSVSLLGFKIEGLLCPHIEISKVEYDKREKKTLKTPPAQVIGYSRILYLH